MATRASRRNAGDGIAENARVAGGQGIRPVPAERPQGHHDGKVVQVAREVNNPPAVPGRSFTPDILANLGKPVTKLPSFPQARISCPPRLAGSLGRR